MNRKKLLIENFLIYGLGGVIGRIIPFIMLPIITYLLPDETYFGINDLFTTVSSLFCIIGIFGMSDTAFRFFFDDESLGYKKSVCSTAFAIVMCVTGVSAIVLLLFGKSVAINVYGSAQYYFLIILNIFSLVANNFSLMTATPTRMLNKRKTYLAVNFIEGVVTYLIAILLILKGWYLSALPLASIISAILASVIFWSLNKKWFSLKFIRKEFIIPFIHFGIPLMPQQLMYYVISSSDKLMIAAMLGQSFNGLYAVGSKFGHISQLIYTAFAGGWLYYKYATMNAPDQVQNISKIFEVLGIISFSSFMGSCLLSKWAISFLFRDIYYGSFIVIPYLFLAPLVQMLFQTVAGQFTIIKKTWPNLIFLMTGAVMNVLLNFLLIPKLGIEGAAIATLAGYVITAVIAVIVCLRMKMVFITGRFYLCTACTITFYIIWRTHINSVILPLFAFIVIMAVMVKLYWMDFYGLIGRKKSDAE